PNVRTVQHAFESHGKQRTWMLRNVQTKHHWSYILEADERMMLGLNVTKHHWSYILEADERMTPALFSECIDAVESGKHVGYYVAERVMFMDRWIKHSTQYPRYQLRLLNKTNVWFDDYGHTEREVVRGSTGFLRETYPHYTCGKGFSRWVDKHNRYSTDEAKETIRQLSGGKVDWRALIGGRTEVERRRALKDFSQRVPGRPLVRFIYMYFFLGGCLDGRAGFTWCVLQAFYEYLILLKVWEIKNQQPASPNAAVGAAIAPDDISAEPEAHAHTSDITHNAA
ncbi:MAG: glycosyltransferase family 2 protein, partial [Cyanobacteria bacterium J06632_3]